MFAKALQKASMCSACWRREKKDIIEERWQRQNSWQSSGHSATRFLSSSDYFNLKSFFYQTRERKLLVWMEPKQNRQCRSVVVPVCVSLRIDKSNVDKELANREREGIHQTHQPSIYSYSNTVSKLLESCFPQVAVLSQLVSSNKHLRLSDQQQPEQRKRCGRERALEHRNTPQRRTKQPYSGRFASWNTSQ